MASGVSLVFKEKNSRLLVALKDTSRVWYVSSAARAAGMTYVYAARVLSLLAADGIVVFEAHGRVKLVRLTEKGLRLAGLLEEGMRFLSKPVAPAQPPATPVPEAPAAEKKPEKEKPPEEKEEKKEKK